MTAKRKEKECRKILKKQCEEVTEVVTEIKQVRIFKYFIEILKYYYVRA